MRLAIILAALVVAALLSACGGGKEVFSIPPTVLSSPTGEVMVLQEGSTEWTEASAGMDIGMGDCVKTGPDGNALLMFFEGSVMEIEEDTQVCIEELSIAEDTGSTFIKVWQQIGRTINRVEQLADPASGYEVETPAGASVTRGTRFEVVVGWDGITTLKTFSGEAWFCVEVEEEEEEERECILVPLGMQCTTEPGGPLGEPIPSPSDLPPPPEEPAPPSEEEPGDTGGGWGGGGGGGGGWVPPPQVSELTLSKSADVATANVGDTITYSFSVENTGDTTISGITLNDPLLETITLDPTTLAPGETANSTGGPYTYTVVEDDLPGPLENTATVSGTDSQGGPVSDKDTESVVLTYTSELTLSKSADVATANVGDTITYSFSVENTGDTTISGITLNDPLLETITLDPTTLAPGGMASSIDGPYTYTVVEGDLPGPLENTATVSGTDSQGEPVSDTATWRVDIYRLGISVAKSADKATANVGDVIIYSFTVENTGDVDLEFTAYDSLLNVSWSGFITQGSSATLSHPYTVPQGADDPLVNEVTATGTDDLGKTVTATATCSVDILHPEISVTKEGPTFAYEGDVITYTITNVPTYGGPRALYVISP